MDTWASGAPDTTVERLLEQLADVAGEADGLTVTGGEPFDQPDALLLLLAGWRDSSGGDVIVFSGHPVEEIAPTLGRCAGLIDVLIADPFVASAGRTKPLRGSDNQRMLGLTTRGLELAARYGRPNGSADRALDILFDDRTGEVFMAGIPQPGDMRRLAAVLAAQGHIAAVSEGREAGSL